MARSPRNPSHPSLTEQADLSRRRLEYKALEDAWRQAEFFLHLGDMTSAQRARVKMAFTLGWQGGTNFHTRTIR